MVYGIYARAEGVDYLAVLKGFYPLEGWDWNSSKKLVFANDFLNHVAAVTYLNPTLKKTYAPLTSITKLRN